MASLFTARNTRRKIGRQSWFLRVFALLGKGSRMASKVAGSRCGLNLPDGFRCHLSGRISAVEFGDLLRVEAVNSIQESQTQDAIGFATAAGESR